jgi:hypothetical protein
MPSPTFSLESRRLWAFRYAILLHEIHEEFSPTHFVTIKFERPEYVEKIKAFTSKLTDAAWYFNRTKDRYLAGRWVIEIEKNNACHLHVLVRAGVYPNLNDYLDDHHDPTGWLKKTTQKINSKIGTVAIVQYSEPVETIVGASNYMYKLNRDDVLLLHKGLKLRQTGQFGNYFVGKTQEEIRIERRKKRAFQEIELKAELICK